MANLFELAERELQREGREPSEALILEYAIKIRKWLDLHSRTVADGIMRGDTIYHYGNRINTYSRAI